MNANKKNPNLKPSEPPRRLDVIPILQRLAPVICMALLAHALPSQAIECAEPQQPLVKIPELVTKDGKLHATVMLRDEQQRLTFRQPPGNKPGQPGNTTLCAPQYVRVLTGIGAEPALPPTSPDAYPDPVPGPTLRARVGDLVELSFINQINPNDFGDSIDRGETGKEGGCDSSSSGANNPLYPVSGNIHDSYPNCFHGSSTANIHFHGTHVNPNSTGDNVFIEVRPSLRDAKGAPIVTPESVSGPFNTFFANCEKHLPFPNIAEEWPKTWSDLPLTYTKSQELLLKLYDKNPEIGMKLWPANKAQLAQGGWPQYYIGAFPYCFRLPTPATTVDKSPIHMGQAPGTHWYHAHKHGSTAIDVANGMTGAFIIEGSYDDDLNKYYGEGWTRKQPVLVINQIGVSPNLMRGGGNRGNGQTDKGPDFSVNGRINPVVTMRPGEVQLWRILNTSGRAGAYFVPPTNGFAWKQLAQDGVQFNNVNYQANTNQSFLLASGNRADFLVKAPTALGSYPIIVKNEVDPSDLNVTKPPQVYDYTLLTVNVSGSAANMDFIPEAPTFPTFLADISRNEVKVKRKIVYASTSPGNGAVHTIDGQKFNDEVGAVVLLNTAEEWKVVNQTYGPPISHPFHIHINPFQVIDVFDPNQTIQVSGNAVPKYIYDEQDRVSPDQCYLNPKANPDDWKPCSTVSEQNMIWWDVFPIPSGAQPAHKDGKQVLGPDGQQLKVPGYFKMRSRFVDYAGFYVTHCHILAHEDRGMMTIVEVAPVKTPYSHH